jgi:quinol monooxygenase YgiN
MYARLVRFSLGQGKSAVAEALAADLAPRISALPGCHGVTVFGDEGGECGLFVLWDTQAHADEAAAVIRPRLMEHIEPHLQSPPDARLFHVLSK